MPQLRFGCVSLERFPLGNQVADLPHQRLVPVDRGVGGGGVVVEAGGAHRGFEIPNLGLALGDARLQIGDALAQRVDGALSLTACGLLLLAVLAGSWALGLGRRALELTP